MQVERGKCGQARIEASKSLLRRLRAWLNPITRDERYLGAAADHADLERRIRVLERADRGPAIVTFNH